MTSNVIPLASHRRNPTHTCTCPCDQERGFTCYPHRLIDLAARIEDLSGDVEEFRFCDLGTFRRLTADVLDTLRSITDECLPDQEATR